MIELTLFSVVVYLTIDKILGPVLRRGVMSEVTHFPRSGTAEKRSGPRRRTALRSPGGLALLTFDPDRNPYKVYTPRGVEIDIGESEWSVGDVARVIDTIEGL